MVVAGQEQPDRRRRDPLQQLAHKDEVADRLAHLLALIPDHRHVDPEARVGGDAHPSRLGDLGLVVGEDEVVTPSVDIQRRAQLGGREHRALDVPTGTPRPPGRRPARLAAPRWLPEDEVERSPLARVVRVGAALSREAQHLLRAEPGEVPVPGQLGDLEIDPAVHRVGHAGIRDPRDPVNHGGNVLAGIGRRIHRQDVDGAHVPVEVADHLVGQLPPADAAGRRHPHHVVIHVGDVADAAHRLTEAAKPPGQHVEGVVGEGVTEVAPVIGGDAADVEANRPAARVEGLERPAGSVEEADHGSSIAADRRASASCRRMQAGGLFPPRSVPAGIRSPYRPGPPLGVKSLRLFPPRSVPAGTLRYSAAPWCSLA